MNLEQPHYLKKKQLASLVPKREANAHKGTFGSLAIIGGDVGMVGAVLLAARAALHSGAGRVYAALLCEHAPAVDMVQPEIMLRKTEAITQLAQLNGVVLGTGLGQSEQALQLLTHWLAQNIPLLLDADALNLIATHAHLVPLVKSRQAETVITPHAGEAARLLATTSGEIQANRIACALRLAQLLKVTCVLKGEKTIIAHHHGNYFINTTGNVGLATGGTGDVLSGLVGSLMVQGLSVIDAANLGVYVHGAAADNLVKSGIGPIGLMASEVLIEARNVLNEMRLKT
jgi:hydroxyethylthiazole kinase-like uncharacterized protein yjeF